MGVLRNEKSQEEITLLYKTIWKQLIDIYPKYRLFPSWCSEADIQLFIANKLLSHLSPAKVHIEFTIPTDVMEFQPQLFNNGRILRTPGKHIISDICILDEENLYPQLLAEIKYTPVYTGYYQLMYAIKRKNEKKDTDLSTDYLKSLIIKLERWAVRGPSKTELERLYLKNMPKFIHILKAFKKHCNIVGYLCVINEVYPNLENILKKEIEKYDPPENFIILSEYYNIKDSFKKILNTLL